MYIVRNNVWNTSIPPLEKFLIERIIQRCDYEEVISNKQKTVTGYIQVKELIKLCELTFQRDRTVKTLEILIEEARSPLLNQNITNDDIINKYFKDLKEYIEKIDTSLLSKAKIVDLNSIKRLFHQLKLFEAQLDQFYYSALMKEIRSIDYKREEEFGRKADYISSLLDLYIPFLVYKGYSITSISEVLRKWILKKTSASPQRLIGFFQFKPKDFYFLINLGPQNKEVEDFMSLLIETYQDLEIVDARQLNEGFRKSEGFKENDKIARFLFNAIDPHSQIRNCYDQLLKQILIRRERPSLHAFNNFFDGCYWGFNNKEDEQEKILLQYDPINVNARKSTLRKTLIKSSKEYKYSFNEDDLLSPTNETLKKSIYYYNIALGSKSIETSLSLLWTALETLLPYRIGTSDIECVQNFVSKSLSLGALGRDVFSFSQRFILTNHQNENALSPLIKNGFANNYSKKGLIQWFEWISEPSDGKKYKILKSQSELLTYQYVKLGKAFSQGNLEFIYKRIASSEESIKFQLQRIYLHRNQIVHSGDLVNEYSNLWLHLEWYVGKLLAYSVIRLDMLKQNKTLEEIFIEIESEHNYLMSYLNSNRKKLIREGKRIIPLLFNESWQTF